MPDSSYELSTSEAAIQWLEQLQEISLDTETTGLDPHTEQLLTLQLGNKERQYVIDARTISLSPFKTLLESRLLVGHNIGFDLKFLYRKGIYPRKVFDTFIVERVLHCGLPSVRGALEFVTERYLGYRLDKTVRANVKEGLTNRVIQYAAGDILPLADIKEKQIQQLINKGLGKASTLENRFVPVLAYIEYCGFRLDPQRWKMKMEKDLAALKAAEEELNSWVINKHLVRFFNTQLSLFESESCRINWSSPQQVAELFEYLKIKCHVIVGGVKKQSVEASVLEKQAAEFDIIPLYLKYKKAQKVVGTYGQSFLDQINPVTGRIHTRFTQIMDTGRMSSGGKNKQTGEEYINFQNIPSDTETRTCFVASPGNQLIICDYSGQEQVVLANRSLDKNLLKFYDEGLADMHSFVASLMYPELAGLSPAEIKRDHSEKRSNVKAGGFAINYGGTGRTIADNLGISLEEGERIYNDYFRIFPGLKQYFQREKQQGVKQGYILISEITGRKSYLPGFEKFQELGEKLTQINWDQYRELKLSGGTEFEQWRQVVSEYYYHKGEIERKSLNYPIQGTSAEITKLSGIYIFDYIVDNNLFDVVLFCNMVHDENVLECPDELADTIAEVIQKAMGRAGDMFCKRVPLKAEPVIGPFWKK